ncbi:MAG: hypothetical protein V4671_00385 [Armatimonadota bacterium]
MKTLIDFAWGFFGFIPSYLLFSWVSNKPITSAREWMFVLVAGVVMGVAMVIRLRYFARHR